ncbi:MAG: hypothetical protein ACRDZ4_09310 [Egibacteraceae bacterium]
MSYELTWHAQRELRRTRGGRDPGAGGSVRWLSPRALARTHDYGGLTMHRKMRQGFTVIAVTACLLPLSAVPARASDNGDGGKPVDDTLDHVTELVDDVLGDILKNLNRDLDRERNRDRARSRDRNREPG